jgi:hypothetical protein
MMLRCALAVTILLVASGCPKRADPSPAKSHTVRLLSEAPEKETTQLTERRGDVEIDTRDHERTPRVVATGETPLLSLEGLSARLYGDEAATVGISVDNFILIEVLSDGGKVLDRVCVGYTDGVLIGNERLDNLGRRAFNFEPGEVNLTPRLPEKGAFKLRATALDYHGVGRVSDVFVAFKPEAGERTGDDLRGQ